MIAAPLTACPKCLATDMRYVDPDGREACFCGYYAVVLPCPTCRCIGGCAGHDRYANGNLAEWWVCPACRKAVGV